MTRFLILVPVALHDPVEAEAVKLYPDGGEGTFTDLYQDQNGERYYLAGVGATEPYAAQIRQLAPAFPSVQLLEYDDTDEGRSTMMRWMKERQLEPVIE